MQLTQRANLLSLPFFLLLAFFFSLSLSFPVLSWRMRALQSTIEAAAKRILLALCPEGRLRAACLDAMTGSQMWRSLCAWDVAAALGCKGRLNRKHVLLWSVAVEFVHASSLIIDDLPLWDDARVRRGRPALHIKYGVRTAHMAATVLMAARDLALSGMRLRPEQNQALAQACALHVARAAHGQWRESAKAGAHADVAETQLETQLVRLDKTGSLFALACLGPAVLLGGDTARAESLGLALGAAYQCADDIRDVEEDREELADKDEGLRLKRSAIRAMQHAQQLAPGHGWPHVEHLLRSMLRSALP